MADEHKPVSMEELAFSNMWQLEGLVRLLDEQGNHHPRGITEGGQGCASGSTG